MVSGGTKDKRSGQGHLASHAKVMRREPTEAEARFWHYAKNRGIGGLKFRRQVAVGRYIADYLCPAQMLIVEIDGGQHGAEGRDKERDAWLSSQGYHILRFWNTDVLTDMSAVADTILATLAVRGKKSKHHLPHPTE